jgi:hypothetical protein
VTQPCDPKRHYGLRNPALFHAFFGWDQQLIGVRGTVDPRLLAGRWCWWLFRGGWCCEACRS